MDEILKQLAQHTGISEDMARKGLGAILSFAKGHLPEGLAGQLQKALPGSAEVASHFEDTKAPAASGGLLDMVTGLAGKVLGGGSADFSKLAGMLGQAGLGADHIPTFVPKALELLKAHVPAELFEKVAAQLPGLVAGAEKS